MLLSTPIWSCVPQAGRPRSRRSTWLRRVVGLGEEQARKRGLKFRLQSQRASDWFTARQAAEPIYGFKVLVDEETDHVLGAHLVGPHADEVINLFAVAIRNQLTATDLKRTMFAYPTGASDIGYMV
jgi:glutathione reductase (NADPH)